jgi:hypothetical protein
VKTLLVVESVCCGRPICQYRKCLAVSGFALGVVKLISIAQLWSSLNAPGIVWSGSAMSVDTSSAAADIVSESAFEVKPITNSPSNWYSVR